MSYYPQSTSIWTAPRHFWHIGFEYGHWDSKWRVLHRHAKHSNTSEVWGSLWQSRHQCRGPVPTNMLLWKPKQYPYWLWDGTIRKNNLPSIIESWEAPWMIHLRKATWVIAWVLAVIEPCLSKTEREQNDRRIFFTRVRASLLALCWMRTWVNQ